MVCRVKFQGSPEMKFQHIRSKGERTQVRRTPDWSIRNIALGSFEGGQGHHEYHTEWQQYQHLRTGMSQDAMRRHEH